MRRMLCYLGNRCIDFPEILHEVRNQHKKHLHRAQYLFSILKRLKSPFLAKNEFDYSLVAIGHMTFIFLSLEPKYNALFEAFE